MQGMVEHRGVAGNQSQPKESQPATLVTPCPAGTCGRALPCPGFDPLHSVMPYDTTLVADRHLLDGVARGEADALRALHQRRSEDTRLNSSHGYISYAVFCLKKKKKQKIQLRKTQIS